MIDVMVNTTMKETPFELWRRDSCDDCTYLGLC